ncbi:AAA family ATPase [Streptomyces sp. NEAU-H22]|uniref:AAA family ATPase n=1 Tax=Streptomyces sp. NEAU-H22 TaxID=2994655 RepID=UPI002259C1DC|nr:AAA family ATPase [Streptomyces sp. NEAU-H22]MCX3290052.1 AAA family ATPase [Streptomyces sp. NEAU-H22]
MNTYDVLGDEPGIPDNIADLIAETADEMPDDPSPIKSLVQGVSSEQHFENCVDRLLGELIDTAGLDDIPALEPVVKDLLFKDTLARLYGESGSLKSFAALDICGCVGTGMDWHGVQTYPGPVVYLVAEGARGIRKRVRAWEQHHGRKMTGVKFLPRPVQTMEGEWSVLIEACRRIRPSLIVIDTQARVTVGVEENSTKEMGEVVHRMEQLRAVTGACVLLVHHSGHGMDRARGSSAVKGAVQTEIGVVRKGKGLQDTTVTLKTDKQKDDEELGDITFALHLVALDGEAKDDGTAVTSVVLVRLDQAARQRAGGPQQDAVRELAAKLDAAEVPTRYGRDRLREACARLGISAANELLGDVIKYRKNQTSDANHLSANLSAQHSGTGQE